MDSLFSECDSPLHVELRCPYGYLLLYGWLLNSFEEEIEVRLWDVPDVFGSTLASRIPLVNLLKDVQRTA